MGKKKVKELEILVKDEVSNFVEKLIENLLIELFFIMKLIFWSCGKFLCFFDDLFIYDKKMYLIIEIVFLIIFLIYFWVVEWLSKIVLFRNL